MPNVEGILIGEYIIALGVSSWSAIKAHQAPWPPTVIKTSIAFGILGIAALGSPELATTLGAGFLLAQLIKTLNGGTPYTGGVPAEVGNSHMTNGIGNTTRRILSWKK